VSALTGFGRTGRTAETLNMLGNTFGEIDLSPVSGGPVRYVRLICAEHVAG
jgi:hypothetical protein